MKIALLSTGGTIEKTYNESDGTITNQRSVLDIMLASMVLRGVTIERVPVMNKDSLEMTAEDRDAVLATVREKLAKGAAPFVITHGTDTMVETGLHLKNNLDALPVAIILTGAMTPLGFERSDGLQNLTESLIAARILTPGVWLVMHNQVFPIDRVRKDRDRAVFVWKSERREAAQIPAADGAGFKLGGAA